MSTASRCVPGFGNGAEPNSRVAGWHVRAGERCHVFFEHESAARRFAAKRKADPTYDVTLADFEPDTERHTEPLASLVQAYGDDYAAAYRFAFDVLPAGRDDHECQVRGELAHRRALGAIGKTTATTLIRDAVTYADELASGGASAAKAAARYSDLVRANLPHLTDDERAKLAAGFDGTVLVALEPALKASSPAADNVDGLTEVGC